MARLELVDLVSNTIYSPDMSGVPLDIVLDRVLEEDVNHV